ncbi:MAG: acyl-CoA reductase [Aquirufa sp.]
MPKASFLQLISFLRAFFTDESNREKIELFIDRSVNENPWFSETLVRHSMQAIEEQFFSVQAWEDFYANHPVQAAEPKHVGIVLAGNLPAVGLHDVLMVLASGHHAALKLSSQDKALMQLYVFAMQSFDAEVPVSIIERLQGMDAVIATGSDFSGGYFAHYFSTIPHIIRKNRSSLAVLKGDEKQEDFKGLAKDIFTYYGLGCRNVSTIAVPATYDLTPLFDELTKETWVLAHSKYSNNFQYHRTLFLLNQVPHFDLGNLLVTENDDLVSPVGVLYVHRYSDEASLLAWIQEREEKIQCKVGLEIGFGQSQHPALDDFADGIDTYDFLINLS